MATPRNGGLQEAHTAPTARARFTQYHTPTDTRRGKGPGRAARRVSDQRGLDTGSVGVLEQHRASHVAVCECGRDRGGARLRVQDVGARAGGEEEAHAGRRAEVDGGVERGPADVAAGGERRRVGRGLGLEQQLHHAGVASGGGEQQRRAARPAAGHRARRRDDVRRRLRADQRGDGALLPLLRRKHEQVPPRHRLDVVHGAARREPRGQPLLPLGVNLGLLTVRTAEPRDQLGGGAERAGAAAVEGGFSAEWGLAGEAARSPPEAAASPFRAGLPPPLAPLPPSL
eukprot:CAMPEP_0202793198 /NCGR_PEP_ID=MMETSP1388-20130828/85317_1 /ASSEMBLY_ACC=CAM_ASM_000864 /TAXON_ID=37098 /ORGANISM="Isochrysis sp, Strain CCMP1244" /LENGTH=285 /DNA_ID=CAMNT_0049462999 /DNA_START=141 /DNA_END=996 /DNA_ORIENTATION=-